MRVVSALAVVAACTGNGLLAGMDVLAAVREKRAALVIGNSRYTTTSPLQNPANDSQDLRVALDKLSFDTQILLDATGQQMRDAVRAFAERANNADVVLFFFAGHGIQIQERNFLLGTDANLTTRAAIDKTTLAADDVVAALELASRINLVFLDACRNNPLSNTLASELRKSTKRGLAKMRRNYTDTLIAFSAKAGDFAEDGTGRNSPYVTALLRHMLEVDVPLVTTLVKVNRDVVAFTSGRQSADFTTSMTRILYLNPKNEETTPSAGEAGRIKDEFKNWQVVCKGRDSRGPCAVVQSVVSEDRANVGLTVHFQRFQDGTRMLRVMAPLGFLMPPGVGLKIDGKDIGTAPFLRCHKYGCFAQVKVPDDLLAQMKRGKEAVFILFQNEGKGIGVPISLDGFDDATRALESY